MARINNYFLTASALKNIAEIKKYSHQEFGEALTTTYLRHLQKAFQQIANDPEIGRLRQFRSAPFLMAPAEKHFVIYNIEKEGIFIAAVLHKRQNIENFITKFSDKLAEDINNLGSASDT